MAGSRQAVNGVYVKANASPDSLTEWEILTDAVDFSKELDANLENGNVPLVDILM